MTKLKNTIIAGISDTISPILKLEEMFIDVRNKLTDSEYEKRQF